MMKAFIGVGLTLAILTSSAGRARAISIFEDDSPHLLAAMAALEFDVKHQHKHTVVLTFPSPISVPDNIGGVPLDKTGSADWLQQLIDQVAGPGVTVIHLNSPLTIDFSSWLQTFAADYWSNHPPAGDVGGNSAMVSGPGTAFLIGSGLLLIALTVRRLGL